MAMVRFEAVHMKGMGKVDLVGDVKLLYMQELGTSLMHHASCSDNGVVLKDKEEKLRTIVIV